MNKAATATAQGNRITDWINDPDNPITADNRPLFLSFCLLTQEEWEIYKHFVDVFDKARCHFFFDIISGEMSRFLNAERISNAALNPPTILHWADYKFLCLSRLKDTKKSEDLMDHLMKVREEGLPVYLWIAERRAERDLLV